MTEVKVYAKQKPAIRAAILSALAALSACLYTVDPIFDDTNSMSASESAVFAEFRRTYDEFVAKWNKGGYEILPTEKYVRVVQESPKLLVQFPTEFEPEMIYVFRSLAVIDGTPNYCQADTDRIDELELIASRFGVEFEIRYGEVILEEIMGQSDREIVNLEMNGKKIEQAQDLPIIVAPTGPKSALQDFILAVFEDGPTYCEPYAEMRD